MKRLRRPSLAVALIVLIDQAGCAHFIVRPQDGSGAMAMKVATRTVAGVGTLGASEVYVYAAKKDEDIQKATTQQEVEKLTSERDSAIKTYWIAVGIVVVIAAVVVSALAASKGGGAKRKVVHTKPGTCSWHGGVKDCFNSVAVCADGQFSPGMQPCYVTFE